jgi:phosphoribosylglycinamide formyltransferase-1
MLKKRIAVLVSGGGTNLQALIDAQKNGSLRSGEIVLVISNRSKAYALERARQNGIDAVFISKKEAGSLEGFDHALCDILDRYQIDLVILAGFLTITGEYFPARYRDRIINIHPALIPAFCGKGFYGLHVHEAVLEYGVKVTGATVHFVNEITDGGAIILQKAIPVLEDDTPETLQQRVMHECEWKLLPEAAELYCAERLQIEGRHVRILPETKTDTEENQ